MRAVICAFGLLLLLAGLMLAGTRTVGAQDRCRVDVERTIRSLEYLPVPWGGEVDITPHFVVDCGGRRSARTLTVVETLPAGVERVPGVGRPPHSVEGSKLTWVLDTSSLSASDPVSFTYRVYLTPDPARLDGVETVDIDWPMDLELATDRGVEHPPGPEPDPLVVKARPGARSCERVVEHQVEPELVKPGEPFHVAVNVRFERCLRPGMRHRAMIVAPAVENATQHRHLSAAVGSLIDAIDAQDPGERGQAGLVLNLATGGRTIAPTVDRSAVREEAVRAPLGLAVGADAVEGIATAMAAIPDWLEHHEIVYLITHASAPVARPDEARRILGDAAARGVEIVPVCVGGGCDPSFAYAVHVPDWPQLAYLISFLPNDHWGAPLTARGVEIEEWLPPHVRLVPDSLHPDAVIVGSQIRWPDLTLQVNRTATFRYSAATETWGRFPVGSPSYVHFEGDLHGEPESELVRPGFVTAQRETDMDDDPCRMIVDKVAAPDRMYLGSQVTVTLTARPYCHDVADRLHVVLSLDRSASMGTRKTEFSYVKMAARSLAEMLAVGDGGDRRFGLVSHGNKPTIDVPLSNDLATIVSLIDRISARGGDDVPQSIEVGAQMLRDARPTSGAPVKEILVVLTDGGQSVTPPSLAVPAANAASDDGITVVSICAVSAEAHCDVVRELASDPSLYFEVQSVHEVLSALVDVAIQLRQKPLGAASIVDDLPPHVHYVPDSAVPPITTRAGNRLIWNIDQLPPTGVQVSYRAVPLLIGNQPTNAHAAIDFEDVLGNVRQEVFPIPTVKTYLNQTPDSCDANVRHTVENERVSVGEQVTATMTVTSDCPPLKRPVDIVLAIDKSDSMRLYHRMENAKLAVDALIDSMDAASSRLGLVVFERRVTMSVPLTNDYDVIRGAVHALTPRGTTDIEPALREASRLLSDGAEQRAGDALVVLLTDGMTLGSVDAMQQAASEITDGGDSLATVCAGTCDPVLPSLASRPDLAFQIDESSVLIELFRSMIRSLQRPYPHGISIDLILSPLVETVSGSFSLPPTVMDDSYGRIVWHPADMITETLSITYAVRPLAPGNIPIGLATFSYDYRGAPAGPVQAYPPILIVDGGTPPTSTPAVLPSATPTLRPTQTPAPSLGRTLWLPVAHAATQVNP